jgi:nucleoside-diphosphate-sugar epimerase
MILVTGATGYTGRRLVARLAATGAQVRCLVRADSDRTPLAILNPQVHVGDLETPSSIRPAFDGVRVVIHLAHIRFAQTVLQSTPPNVQRLVMVSSLQALSRVPSLSVDRVLEGEAAVAASGLPCVTLRPSMIYGPGNDRNISLLAARIRRHRVQPLVGDGRALQQPVFVDDVAAAVLAAAQGRGRAGQTYALCGPDPHSYTELVDLVGAAVGRRPLKVRVPVWLALVALRACRWAGLSPAVNSEQIRRLQENKACSIDAARRDLGFEPVSFPAGLTQCGYTPRVPD